MLKLKIPPPVVGLTLAALVLLVNHLVPTFRLDSPVLKALAYPMVVIGVLIELWSVGLFVKVRTTVNPLKPNKSRYLVISGMYRYTRNPMYLGLLLLLIGFVFWIGNPLALVMPVMFVWYITHFQIKPEEEALIKIFGDEFISYKAHVRRWL